LRAAEDDYDVGGESNDVDTSEEDEDMNVDSSDDGDSIAEMKDNYTLNERAQVNRLQNDWLTSSYTRFRTSVLAKLMTKFA
jgi:hypothetical protein